jgi:hypothetical protein
MSEPADAGFCSRGYKPLPLIIAFLPLITFPVLSRLPGPGISVFPRSFRWASPALP